MDSVVIEQLLALNRAFYARFAPSFSNTRRAERVNLQPIMPYLANGVKVVELGCGNGRLAVALDGVGLRLAYRGVDQSESLLAIARSRALQQVRAQFTPADIAQRGWSDALRADAPFDLALALAVLHHIPSQALRANVLREVRALLRPAGHVVMSNWQFTRSARLRRKVVPWKAVGIDARALEDGDALIDWQRDGTGYRYCHLLSEAEMETLAAQSGFVVRAQFNADDDLNLYSVLQRAD